MMMPACIRRACFFPVIVRRGPELGKASWVGASAIRYMSLRR